MCLVSKVKTYGKFDALLLGEPLAVGPAATDIAAVANSSCFGAAGSNVSPDRSVGLEKGSLQDGGALTIDFCGQAVSAR